MASQKTRRTMSARLFRRAGGLGGIVMMMRSIGGERIDRFEGFDVLMNDDDLMFAAQVASLARQRHFNWSFLFLYFFSLGYHADFLFRFYLITSTSDDFPSIAICEFLSLLPLFGLKIYV